MLSRNAVCSLLALATLCCFGCDEATRFEVASPSKQGLERGADLYETCEPCHGEDALGKADLQAPAIAGLSSWYIQEQVKKFQDGRRGAHPDDHEGLRMRPMSRTLLRLKRPEQTAENIANVSDYVASLPAPRPDSTFEADRSNGMQLYKPCAACHGNAAEGNQGLSAPRLNRSNDWYIVSQLRKFKHGIRGAADGDVTGAQMRPNAMALEDEKAMRDVASYIRTLNN